MSQFALVVTQRDLGWFHRSYVEGLHENLSREIDSSITGDRSGVFEESYRKGRASSDARIGDSGNKVEPTRPSDPQRQREALLVVAPDGGTEGPVGLPCT